VALEALPVVVVVILAVELVLVDFVQAQGYL
jgi:hypothetical protein